MSESMEKQPPHEVLSPQISSPPGRPFLRNDVRVICEAWLIGNILQDLTPKKGSQLPTNGDVLRYFIFLNRGPMQKDKRDDVIKFVILKAEQFWEHSGIPVTPIRAGHSKKKLKKLISQYENLVKHKTEKNFPAMSESFLESLLLLFDISAANAISIIEQDRCRTKKMILEDVQFLEDQRSCRKMELGGLDKTHFAKVTRKLAHNEKEIERAVIEKRRRAKASTKINIESSDSDSLDADADIEPNSIKDPDFVFPSTSSGAIRSTQGPSPSCSTINLKLPRNPFTSKIISNMGDRLNLSAGQRTAFMGAILTEGGVALEKATLSIKSTWTAGKEIRKSSAQTIKATFTVPKHATLHWDGKLIPDFKKEKKRKTGYIGIWYARL